MVIFSCNPIRYWKKSNQYAISNENIAVQIKAIKNANPEKDANIAHLLLDNRFVGVTSVGIVYPGIELDLLNLYGGKEIWGTTDVYMNNKLYSYAFIYAYRYNKELLRKIGKTSQFKEIKKEDLEQYYTQID